MRRRDDIAQVRLHKGSAKLPPSHHLVSYRRLLGYEPPRAWWARGYIAHCWAAACGTSDRLPSSSVQLPSVEGTQGSTG